MRENIGKNQKASPADFLKSDTEFAPTEVQRARYSVCKSCDELTKITKQCKQCGCFMNLKVKLSHAECPLDKWKK